MRALATTLVLVFTAATAAVAAPVQGQVTAEAAPGAADLATSTASPPSVAAPGAAAVEVPAPRKTPAAPLQAVVDKVGQGDRLSLAGDHRGALFAYQDAVYMQPTYAPARVRLGRAYLALRYPEQAIAQAEAALAEDPDSAEARKLLDEARAAPPRPKTGAVVAPAAPTAPVAVAPAAPAKAGARVFKLSSDGEAPPARPAAAVPRAAGTAGGAAATATGGVAAPVAIAAVPVVEAARADVAAPEPTSAAQRQVAALHYRTALGFLQNRDWTKAVAALSDAILADPTLAVAYSARGSAQFGLGKYGDAAEDYGAAIRLDPKLGTPIYGLAECHRVLGDGKKAAEMYDRYAQSTAADVRDDLRAIAARRAKELR
jgi:tetratricopeptide (TPR) repeat protein